MATGEELTRAAPALTGTTAGPHFDRIAFKAARTRVTLAALSEAELDQARRIGWAHALPMPRKPRPRR